VRHDLERVGGQALAVDVGRNHADVVQGERLQPGHVEGRDEARDAIAFDNVHPLFWLSRPLYRVVVHLSNLVHPDPVEVDPGLRGWRLPLERDVRLGDSGRLQLAGHPGQDVC
jgi:hypothetical protein